MFPKSDKSEKRSDKDIDGKVCIYVDIACCLWSQCAGCWENDREGVSAVQDGSARRTWASRQWSSLCQGPKPIPCIAGGKAGVPNKGIMGPIGLDMVLEEISWFQICIVWQMRSLGSNEPFRWTADVHSKAQRLIVFKWPSNWTESLGNEETRQCVTTQLTSSTQ